MRPMRRLNSYKIPPHSSWLRSQRSQRCVASLTKPASHSTTRYKPLGLGLGRRMRTGRWDRSVGSIVHQAPRSSIARTCLTPTILFRPLRSFLSSVRSRRNRKLRCSLSASTVPAISAGTTSNDVQRHAAHLVAAKDLHLHLRRPRRAGCCG
jgi:hypothetical protein